MSCSLTCLALTAALASDVYCADSLGLENIFGLQPLPCSIWPQFQSHAQLASLISIIHE